MTAKSTSIISSSKHGQIFPERLTAIVTVAILLLLVVMLPYGIRALGQDYMHLFPISVPVMLWYDHISWVIPLLFGAYIVVSVAARRFGYHYVFYVAIAGFGLLSLVSALMYLNAIVSGLWPGVSQSLLTWPIVMINVGLMATGSALTWLLLRSRAFAVELLLTALVVTWFFTYAFPLFSAI